MKSSSGHRLWRIAAKEFSDRYRSGWVVACAVVWLGAVGITSILGLLHAGRVGVHGYERTAVSLLNLVQYLVPLLGLLLGHDLVAGEREEGTLRLILASGTTREQLLLGKFLGGCLTLAAPLVLGFAVAGLAIGITADGTGLLAFVRLAGSGLGLGIVCLGIGTMISTFCRTRVQALVAALLGWCVAVFAFDLVALGVLLSTRSSVAAQEIELVCDATHLAAGGDLHAALEALGEDSAVNREAPRFLQDAVLAGVNPVGLFRAVNLFPGTSFEFPLTWVLLGALLWVTATVGVSCWKFRRIDL
jgi:Cu-processing system permease protein